MSVGYKDITTIGPPSGPNSLIGWRWQNDRAVKEKLKTLWDGDVFQLCVNFWMMVLAGGFIPSFASFGQVSIAYPAKVIDATKEIDWDIKDQQSWGMTSNQLMLSLVGSYLNLPNIMLDTFKLLSEIMALDNDSDSIINFIMTKTNFGLTKPELKTISDAGIILIKQMDDRPDKQALMNPECKLPFWGLLTGALWVFREACGKLIVDAEPPNADAALVVLQQSIEEMTSDNMAYKPKATQTSSQFIVQSPFAPVIMVTKNSMNLSQHKQKIINYLMGSDDSDWYLLSHAGDISAGLILFDAIEYCFVNGTNDACGIQCALNANIQAKHYVGDVGFNKFKSLFVHTSGNLKLLQPSARS